MNARVIFFNRNLFHIILYYIILFLSYCILDCSDIMHCLECNRSGICTKCEGDLVFRDGNCECPKHLYSADLLNPSNSTKCKACHEEAICEGGSNIILKKGNWRNNLTTDDIFPCYNNEDNCIGGYRIETLCKKGHIGPLCEDCDIQNLNGEGKFSHTSDFDCETCENIIINLIKIIVIIILQMILLL